MVSCCYLLLGVSRLGQQLQKYTEFLDSYRNAGKAPLKNRTSGYLALDERSEQDKDWDTGPDNEVNKVPKGQTTHFSQGHLFDLQAKSVPLVPQRTLKANQDHLQSCENREGEFLWKERKLWKISRSYPDTQPGWWTRLSPHVAGPSPCHLGWNSELEKHPA